MHDSCLKCISCKRHLGDFKVKFFKNKEGTLFHCEPCLLENSERCPYCKDHIEQNHGKIYKGKKYHRKCVELVDVCDECGRSLVESTHMLSLDEPKEPEEPEEPVTEPQESPETPQNESPKSPRKTSADRTVRRRSSRGSRGSKGSRGSSPKMLKSQLRKDKSPSLDLRAEDESGTESEEEEEEEEKKNILTLKKQYCQECFKHIYNMEICHVCKGPLKKHKKKPQESTSTLQKALAISKDHMGASLQPGGHSSRPASRHVLENAFKFPDGKHPEEFMFESFICHWECMQCLTCQKPVIGEPVFIMAEKHKLWCQFCAEHRFSSYVSAKPSSHSALGKQKINAKSTPTARLPSPPHHVSKTPSSPSGSNIKIGIGPTDIREFKFNVKTAQYELEVAQPAKKNSKDKMGKGVKKSPSKLSALSPGLKKSPSRLSALSPGRGRLSVGSAVSPGRGKK